jgi:transcriptional regulator with PAS, ATPase and Fis domain
MVLENAPFNKTKKTHDDNSSLEDIEKSHIAGVLESCGGNKTKAGKILGISQATLWRKLKEMER